MNLLETYIEEIHSEHERKTDFGYVVDVDITEDCYGVITRKKKTFLKDEWADVKRKGSIGRKMKGTMCRNCQYHKSSLYQHYPCRDCDGEHQPPITCYACRKFTCEKISKQYWSKGYCSIKPCDDFEWD